MNRIIWLDASRGLAIILLVVMHYVGALESRSFISKDTLDVLYGLLRIATPFFMFTFGLAFYITASKKIERIGLANYYINNVIKRMFYIFLGREIIVLILSFQYPEMVENLWSILLFQEFSKGGEILIFYFFAFLIAPLNVVFLQKAKAYTYITFWLIVYATAFYIGSNYVDRDSNNVLRFLFYDIYAFFPFLIVVATAMLVAKFFVASQHRKRFLSVGLTLGIIFCAGGFLLLHTLTNDIWLALADAEFKMPPHPGYMFFYLGEVFIVISVVALTIKNLPTFINNIFSLLGRNTLVSYVTHYLFFAAVPLAALLGGGPLYEALFFITIITLTFLGIRKWDAHKTMKKTDIKV